MSWTTRADRELGALIPEGAGTVKTTAGCFSLVCGLPDPGWRVEIGVGGQGSGGARPRKRPQGLDGDAVRRTLFRTGRIEKACAAFGLAEQGSVSSSGPVSRRGAGEGLLVIPSPRVSGLKRFAGERSDGVNQKERPRRYRGS
jgi:hypothetical protein